MDRIYRELETNGTSTLSFRTNNFILKITVPKVNKKEGKVIEKVYENQQRFTEKFTEKFTESNDGLIENQQRLIEKLIEKAATLSDRLTENRITILELMIENPYISVVELAKAVGISVNSIMRNQQEETSVSILSVSFL